MALLPTSAVSGATGDLSQLNRVAHAPQTGGVVFVRVPSEWRPGSLLAVTFADGNRVVLQVPGGGGPGSILRVSLPERPQHEVRYRKVWALCDCCGVTTPPCAQGEGTFRIVVPPGASGGARLTVHADGRLVQVGLPPDAAPGQLFEFTLPPRAPNVPAPAPAQRPTGRSWVQRLLPGRRGDRRRGYREVEVRELYA